VKKVLPFDMHMQWEGRAAKTLAARAESSSEAASLNG